MMVMMTLWPPPAKQLVVFEGYDGSGKSTLIGEAQRYLTDHTVRIVGRKAEPELRSIAGLLEADEPRPDIRTDILLRLAVEAERTNIILRELERNDLVICDRGVMSFVSWFDYLNVPRGPFQDLIDELTRFYTNAVTIVCSADFDTCWARSSTRTATSRKDRLGEDANRGFFEMYAHNLADADGEIVVINTAETTVAQATAKVLETIRPLLTSR